MKKVMSMLALVGLFGLMSLLSGCYMFSHNREAKIRQYSRISDVNRRMLVDDFEGFLMLDRPSSLSRWHVHHRIQ